MDKPQTAVRYFTVPKDINVPPGLGWTEDASAFSLVFVRLLIPGLFDAPSDTQELLVSRLRKCVAGQRIELPEVAWKALAAAIPRELAQRAPDLYIELLPHFTAVRMAPSVKPDGWDAPTEAPPLAAE
jgi:hypothetical protein